MAELTFGSLFSGIGGFDLGFERAGMSCAWQVEIDKAARGVLDKHWPNVPRVEDVRNVGRDIGAVDVICGGFPCQDVSVAGKRAGLARERSGLWHEFRRILAECGPRWVVVENVPGLLSSNCGRDFATVLQGLVECGYGVAWRILDAQYFGVAQRRRRVFVVGSLGDGRAAQVLFESEGGCWNPAPGRATGQEVAGTLDARASAGGFPGTDGALNGYVIPVAYGGNNINGWIDVATTCNAHGGSGRLDFESETFVFESQYARNGRGAPSELVPPLKSQSGESGKGDGAPLVMASGVRRLTPTECERLQGFPDGWTAGQSDSAGYRQLGNAVCVPVAEWIGRRIVACES